MGAETFRGREGFIEFMRRWTEDFQGYGIQLERLIDAGDDRVVGLLHQWATGKGSGVPVELNLARRQVEAWNRSDLTAYLATFRSDAEIDWSRARALYKGVYRGHAEHETFWDEFWSTFEASELEVHDLTEAGSEVVVWNTARMRGRDGIEVTARSALVFTVENGEITRLRLFQERSEALEAVGLSE